MSQHYFLSRSGLSELNPPGISLYYLIIYHQLGREEINKTEPYCFASGGHELLVKTSHRAPCGSLHTHFSAEIHQLIAIKRLKQAAEASYSSGTNRFNQASCPESLLSFNHL